MMRAVAGMRSAYILLLAVAGVAAHAQEPGSKRGDEPIVYRRVFVPEEDLPTQARGLLPMKREEFEKRIETTVRNSSRRIPSRCRIESAAYRAVFRSGRLVSGTADLDVQCPSGEKSFVGLGDVNIAISAPQWKDPLRNALLGLSDSAKYVLQADGPAELMFSWTAAGRPADGGGWSFDLSLPQANRSELELELPEGWTLTAESGLLQESVLSDASEKPDEARGSDRRWTLEVGGSSQIRFLVRPPSKDRDESLLLVSELASYRFAPGLLDAEVTLGLTVHQLPLREMALRVDPALSVLSVRNGDQRLKWLEGAPDENGVRRYIVELPEPLSVGSHTLQISATAEWSTEEKNAVPRIHVEHGIWQTGTATLIGTGDVRINAKSQDGARQVLASGTDTTTPGTLRYEYFSAAARIDVIASRPKARLNVLSGLSLAVDSGQATSTLIADLSTAGSVNDGSRFEIEAVASRRWIIESVETIPSDLLEDRTLTTLGPDSQRLLVRLRRPLSGASPTRLIVRARRQRLRDGEVSSGDLLRFLTFNGVGAERRLISVVATDPTMEPTLLSDSQLERRDAATLSPYERTLLESPTGAILIETSTPESVGRLTLRRSEARYSAEIESAVRISQNTLATEVRLLIRPEVSSISRVLVRSAPKLRGTVEWKVEGDEAQTVVAKELSGMTSNEEDESLLQLQLPRAQSGPIVLIGRWSEAFDDELHVPLLSLPEANSQVGHVQVATGSGASARVAAEGMHALPLPSAASDVINPLLARYQYEPGQEARLGISPRSSAERSLNLLIRERVISSTFSSDGSASHVAVYQLGNLGEDRLVLGLPAGATTESVEVDDYRVSLVERGQDGENLIVPLPDGVRKPKVTLRYTTASQERSLWFANEFRAPLPQVAVPSLRGGWVVRLAPGLRCWTAQEPGGGEAAPRRVFDLFSPLDWTHLGTSWFGGGAKEPVPAGAEIDNLGKGWSEYEFELTDSPYATVLVYNPALISICGIALAIGVFAVVGALPYHYARLMLIGFGCLTAAMFWFSPMPLVPLCWWALTGMVTICVWRGLRPRGEVSQATEQLSLSHATRRSFAIGARLLQVLFLIALLASVRGSRSGAEEPGVLPSKETPRIVIPVDLKQLPTGDYVYLSEDFYEVLHQVSASQQPNAPAWVIDFATYTVSITDEEASLRPGGCDIIAEYEFHTFAKGARVQLPLGRGDVHLVASASTLDGSPTVTNWNDSHDVLSVDVPDSGQHRLVLRLGVALKQQDEHYIANVPIPKIPQSRARLIIAPDIGRGELESFAASVAPPAGEGSLETDLAPSGQLYVRYLPSQSSSSPRANVSAAQSIWWKVRPGSVSAEGRFDFSADSGELREIVLRTDPRVKLLPLDSDAGIVRQWTEEGPMNLVHLELAPPYPVEASLHAKFLVAEVVGRGTFVPPAIDAVADRTDRHWEALSATPGWEVEGPSELLPPASFIQAWGSASGLPELAWDRAALGTVPAILIRPSVKLRSADQELAFSLGRDIGRLFYRAVLKQEEQPLAQCSLAMTSDLRVRNVTAVVNEKSLSVEWWQSVDGSLTVRFQEPQLSPTQLLVEADWELPGQKALVSLPLVRLQSVEASDYQVRVFRESNASLKWERRSGLTSIDEGLLGGYVPNRGRLEGHFVANGTAEPQLRLRVEPDAPEIAGHLFIAVNEESKAWEAELHCDLKVIAGSLDVMRFELPDHWTGPFDVEPAVDYTLLTLPGQSRKQLVVRPQQAITDRMTLVIRGPLKTTLTDTVRAVDVELLEAPSIDRYVALVRNANTPLTWETSGLQVIENDASIFPASLSSDRYEVFRVIAERFEAVGRRAAHDKQVREPIVRLADIQVSWQNDRRYFGTARFDLHPERMPDCTLSIPTGCRVASVMLDDAIAEVTAAGPHALRIDLGRRQLPVQLEVAFVGRLPLRSSSADPIALPTPNLESIPIKRTVWTVSPALGAVSTMPVDAQSKHTASHIELERMASCMAALEKAVNETDGPEIADLRGWALRWNRQFETAAKRMRPEIRSNTVENSVTEEMHRLQAQHLKLIQVNEHMAFEESAVPTMTSPSDLGPAVQYISAEGKLATLKLQYENRFESGATFRRHVVAGWTILGLLGLALLNGRRAVFEWLKVNSWLAVAMFGIVATFMFPGNPVGWLIALAGAVFAMIPQWPRGALR